MIAQAATASALPTPGGGPHGAIAAAHGTALLHMCFLLKGPGQFLRRLVRAWFSYAAS